jgi:hypothetical protein
MAKLNISNLYESKAMDRAARTAIYGGINDWIASYRPGSSLPYTFINNVNIVVNPVFNTLNQLNLTNIDVAENTDSLINIDVDQASKGENFLVAFTS